MAEAVGARDALGDWARLVPETGSAGRCVSVLRGVRIHPCGAVYPGVGYFAYKKHECVAVDAWKKCLSCRLCRGGFGLGAECAHVWGHDEGGGLDFDAGDDLVVAQNDDAGDVWFEDLADHRADGG